MRTFPAPIGRAFGVLTGTASPPGTGLLGTMQEHTNTILDSWGEILTLKRRNVVYDNSGMSTVTWIEIATFVGDWQPMKGSTMMARAGVKIKHGSKIIAAHTVDVRAGDRVYRDDGSYEYVTSVDKYEDHITISLAKTEVET